MYQLVKPHVLSQSPLAIRGSRLTWRCNRRGTAGRRSRPAVAFGHSPPAAPGATPPRATELFARHRTHIQICTMRFRYLLVVVASVAQAALAQDPSAPIEGSTTGNRPAPDQRVRVLPKVVPDSCEVPQYSARARRDEMQGAVKVRFDVSNTGKVVGMLMIKSSGHSLLDATTLASMRTCNFEPGTLDGRPFGMSVVLEHVWRLQ